MSPKIPKYTDAETAARLVSQLGVEYAMVENPSYVFPPYEAYPLARKRTQLDEGLRGAVMDMDGTTTTTEPLCIHSLEMMVRRITGREHDLDWRGLDPKNDYPHIIGNSTTKHVEYLIETYGAEIDPDALRRFFLYAAAWTLSKAQDKGRKNEVRSTLAALGAGDVLDDARFVELLKAPSLETPVERMAIAQLAAELAGRLAFDNSTNIVRAAIDIYYQRYHEILGHLAAGEGEEIAGEVFGEAGRHLVEPMPGIGIFLAMLKGWLGADLEALGAILSAHLEEKPGARSSEVPIDASRLAALGIYFERNPVKVAVVTSSIFYEADIVLGEVFRVLRGQIAQWPIAEEKRAFLLERFASPHTYYDAFITASDSSEIRLKPHRDLYSLALHRIGIRPDAFHQVIGFEDSESGAIAIRAAGIPLCCALPFTMTEDHAFDAATHTCPGGIPEVILKHRVFLPDALLENPSPPQR